MRKSGWIAVGLAFAAGLLLAAWGRGLRAEPAKDSDRDGGPSVNVGEPCTVYLRGDASGASIHDRILDLSLLIQRHGNFEGMDARWVIIRDASHRYEIPVSSIMLIEYGGKSENKATSETHKPEHPDDAGRPKLDLR